MGDDGGSRRPVPIPHLPPLTGPIAQRSRMYLEDESGERPRIFRRRPQPDRTPGSTAA